MGIYPPQVEEAVKPKPIDKFCFECNAQYYQYCPWTPQYDPITGEIYAITYLTRCDHKTGCPKK